MNNQPFWISNTSQKYRSKVSENPQDNNCLKISLILILFGMLRSGYTCSVSNAVDPLFFLPTHHPFYWTDCFISRGFAKLSVLRTSLPFIYRSIIHKNSLSFRGECWQLIMSCATFFHLTKCEVGPYWCLTLFLSGTPITNVTGKIHGWITPPPMLATNYPLQCCR